MVKLMLFALLAVALIAVVALLIGAASAIASRRPVMPAASASNDQWVRYYEMMASSARRSGNTDSAASYESMAETYRKLRDEQV